jgi:GTP-binding protein Era
MAAEFIRERLLLNLQEEIPHGAAVVIEKMKPRKGSGDLVDISAVIYCEKENHKGIIIGKGGEALKKSASEARVAIEELLGARVNLACHVKVSPDWRNRAGILNEIGYTE